MSWTGKRIQRNKLLRLDLHVHTRHSKDSVAPISSIVAGGDAPSDLGLGRPHTEVSEFDGTPAWLAQDTGAGRVIASGPAKPRQVLR